MNVDKGREPTALWDSKILSGTRKKKMAAAAACLSDELETVYLH